MSLDPTPEQQRLIEVIQQKELKAIGIEAGPGCGKSSTLVLLAGHVDAKGQMTCFGADIRKDLNQKLKDSPFDAKTFNSIGWSTIRKELKRRLGRQPSFEEMKTDEAKYRKLAEKAIAGEYFADYNIPALLIPHNVKYDAMLFMEKLAYFCMVTMTNNTHIQDLVRLIADYEFEPRLDLDDDAKAQAYEEEIKDWGLDNLTGFMQLGEAVIESDLWMTFTDQVYYTVQWNLRPWQTEYLFIDEAQDISEMELRLLSRCVKRGGYVVIVGDPSQSIMRFKGSIPGSFQRVVKYFKAQVFPLSATFRCPRRIVRLANLVKPSLQAFFDREGAIELKPHSSLLPIVQNRTDRDGEMAIIARTNAPLIRMCLDLIASDIPATVLGRDIGKQLNKLLDKIADTSGYSFDKLLDHLDTYRKTHVAVLVKRMTDENEIKAFTDTLDALAVLIERHTSSEYAHTPATSLDDLKQRIDDLFSDPKDDLGTNTIKLMTAHKSKGMEFDTVLLYNDFRISKVAGEKRVTAMPVDETYVWFVAVTRTKNRLVVLDDKCPDWLFGHLPGQPGYELPPFTPPAEAPIEAPDDLDTEAEAPERALTPQGEAARTWAQQRLNDRNFVILDTETTDLEGEIIQLAVCDPDGNALINTRLKPAQREITPESEAIHGISNADVADAPTFAEILHTLVEVIRDKIVICYNANFDRARVQTSTHANGLPLINHLPKAWNCAMLRYCHYNPDKLTPWGKSGGWWKLEEALAQENIQTDGVDFHDAMADVRATLAVIQAMAGVPITAFDGTDDPLPLKTETGTFALGDAVQIKVTRRTGTVHAYLPPDQYSVKLDGDTARFSTYTESQLRTRYLYDAPIGPEPFAESEDIKAGDGLTVDAPEPSHTDPKAELLHNLTPTPLEKGDRVQVKATGRTGTVFKVGTANLSVKLDTGNYMAYRRTELLAIPPDPAPPAEPKPIVAPLQVLPKPTRVSAKVRKQVRSMLQPATVTVDHIDEMIALLQELRAEKLQKAEA